MERRKINKSKLQFLREELDIYTAKEIITSEQHNEILDLYEESTGLNFIKVLLVVGSILIGLGILSFIASNWQAIGRILKFFIVVFACGASYYSGYKLDNKYPKTARSLIYLSILIYGSGIFLIGQMFNYGGNFTNAFLMWTIGILPMAFVLKDEYILLFAHVLTLVYLNGHFRFRDIPIISILLIGGFYFLNRYFKNSKLITFFTNIISINLILYLCHRYNIEGTYTLGILLVVGLLMYYIPIAINREIFRIQGSIVFGMSGLLLTLRDVWNDLYYIGNPDFTSIIFAIIYIVFLLFLTKKGNLISLVFICITIFRYYSDTFYDFMPKSLFFIIGGLILLGFGYYFEKMRKKLGGINNEA